MNKIKSWFKKTFKPEDDYADIRYQMGMVLEVSQMITKAKNGDLDLRRLYELLSQISLIDFVWVDQLLTPMELACLHGNPWCVAALIANGADVNGKERNKHRVTIRPIHYACKTMASARSLDCVRMLVEKGADFKALDGDGEQPIQHAAMAGNVEVVEYLLELGADVDCTGANNSGTPLVWACTIPCREKADSGRGQDDTTHTQDTSRDLSPQQPGPQAQSSTGTQAAAESSTGTQAAVESSTGAQAAAESSLRALALEDSSDSDSIPEARVQRLIRLLLDHGANVNKMVESYADCLTMATPLLYTNRALILLAYGANINNPRSPKYQCIVKVLLRTVSEKRVKTDRFFTMLHLLLAAGARITLESLENDIRPVLDCRQELASVRQDVYQLLEQFAAAPLPLKMLCRVRIRAHLPTDIDVSVRRLPLNTLLQRYLRFEDIAPQRTDIE